MQHISLQRRAAPRPPGCECRAAEEMARPDDGDRPRLAHRVQHRELRLPVPHRPRPSAGRGRLPLLGPHSRQQACFRLFSLHPFSFISCRICPTNRTFCSTFCRAFLPPSFAAAGPSSVGGGSPINRAFRSAFLPSIQFTPPAQMGCPVYAPASIVSNPKSRNSDGCAAIQHLKPAPAPAPSPSYPAPSLSPSTPQPAD